VARRVRLAALSSPKAEKSIMGSAPLMTLT
jgi:hypothetical protein